MQTQGHLEKFVILGCEVRFRGERRGLRVLPGVRFQGASWIALAKEAFGGDGRPRGEAVELPLSRYAGVTVRSRKANRLMLYTRFIRPIFALALTRPIVRTILPPMLVC